MRIKYFLIIIIKVMFSCINSYSQDIVNTIKNFYKNADMNCYIDKTQKRILEDYELYVQWGEWDSTFRVHVPPPKIDLHQSNTVPILNIQFVNTGNYNYFDNIYDYITIDSTWAFTFAYIDKQMNIKAFVNYAASNGSYWDISDRKSPYKEHKQIIKKISKYEPDLILRSAMLGGGFGVMYDDGFMYIKGNKIYKFIMNSGKSYELNEYFRNYLRIDDIHRYLDFSYIPLIYNKEDKNKRRTGNARENEKIICP